MRKALSVAAFATLVLGACGSSSSKSSSSTTSGSATTTGSATTDTTPGSTAPTPTLKPVPRPSVSIPSVPVSALKVTTLKPGAGPAAVKGDTVVVYYIGVRSRDGVEFDNNYDSGQPFSVQLGAGSVIKGWDQGLIGVQAGSRVQLDIPSALAYGAQAQGDVIGANEDLTFVLDVLAVVPATDPKAEPVLVIKPTKVTELTTDDLVTGTGSTAATSQNVTFNYIFYRADTGAKLFSSWSSQPASIPLVHDGQLDCLIDGLVGMKVGGRREITCPAAKVFGGQGNTSLGIPAGVDLVMVADLLAAY